MELAGKQTASQSQKLMIFVLTMALYGPVSYTHL